MINEEVTLSILAPRDLQLAITVGAFVLGALTFLAGVVILVSGILRKELQELVRQTARVAQKGLADELSGLVGNASTLIVTLNEMARTAAGIGVFLTLLGLVLVAASGWLAFQIH
jgi:hypothetical protein